MNKTVKCSKCNQEYKIKSSKELFIGLNKENSSNLSFIELFKNKNERLLKDYRCKLCNYLNEETNQKIEYDFKESSFLVLRICGIWKNKILSNLIHDFCPDNIFIPGDKSEYRFNLKAAIVYTPLGVHNGMHMNSGHYVCWKKEQNGWMEISDSTGTIHQKFLNSLDNVYLLFFEKLGQGF